MDIKRKTLAHFPTERNKVCSHEHVAYSGRIPCTGSLRCTMCLATFEDWQEVGQAQQEAEIARDMGF